MERGEQVHRDIGALLSLLARVDYCSRNTGTKCGAEGVYTLRAASALLVHLVGCVGGGWAETPRWTVADRVVIPGSPRLGLRASHSVDQASDRSGGRGGRVDLNFQDM